MNWDNVEMIRNAQASAKARFEATAIATQEEIQKVVNSEAAKKITMPRLTEIEQMIFKMRSELIDYIVAHGLVDGLVWDGVLQPIQNGKIVITKEMIEILTEKLGYFTEADVQAFLEQYLPENHYISDAAYVHTDNNYTTTEKQKLSGIEDGAEVNKIIDLIFNGVSVLDDGTRVATINITPEDIKRWYESNPDTNAFTDADKAKLAGIADGADVNRVDDVILNGRSTLDEQKRAIITKEDIKAAYEQNPDTNAFTDNEKLQIENNKMNIDRLFEDTITTEGRVNGLEERELVYEIVHTIYDQSSFTDYGSGTWVGWGILRFKQDGRDDEYAVPLSGSGHHDRADDGSTIIDMVCERDPLMSGDVSVLQDIEFHIGGSSAGGQAYLWNNLTCYHAKSITDLTFELGYLTLENTFESPKQIFRYTDKSLAWLEKGEYEPIRDGDMVIIGYNSHYEDKTGVRIGQNEQSSAELSTISVNVPSVKRSKYLPIKNIGLVAAYPLKFGQTNVFGVEISSLNVNELGRLELGWDKIGQAPMGGKWIYNDSIRTLPCGVISSLDRWSLTIIRS